MGKSAEKQAHHPNDTNDEGHIMLSSENETDEVVSAITAAITSNPDSGLDVRDTAVGLRVAELDENGVARHNGKFVAIMVFESPEEAEFFKTLERIAPNLEDVASVMKGHAYEEDHTTYMSTSYKTQGRKRTPQEHTDFLNEEAIRYATRALERLYASRMVEMTETNPNWIRRLFS